MVNLKDTASYQIVDGISLVEEYDRFEWIDTLSTWHSTLARINQLIAWHGVSRPKRSDFECQQSPAYLEPAIQIGGYSGFAPYWKDLNFCLAEIQGILVGVLGYTIANIDRIVVHSDYRRLGIGTELISRATTHLATMGHTTVEVQTVTPEWHLLMTSFAKKPSPCVIHIS